MLREARRLERPLVEIRRLAAPHEESRALVSHSARMNLTEVQPRMAQVGLRVGISEPATGSSRGWVVVRRKPGRGCAVAELATMSVRSAPRRSR